MARLSLIVISHNRPDDLLELLESVLRQDGRESALEETLILDNGSTVDYTRVRRFLNEHPELRATLHHSATNLGVAGGRNRLMREALGDLLLVLDDDMVIPDTSALRKLSALLEAEPFAGAETGIVSLRVVYHDTGEVQRPAFAHKKYDSRVEEPQFLTSFYAGGAHLIKREVVESAGLYPEDFFYGMEEYDLAYRALEVGYSIGYSNSVTIEHKESRLGRAPSHEKVQMQWVNKSKVAWRYLPARYFVSTSILWSFNYLRRTRFDVPGFIRGSIAVVRIPFTETRRPIGRKALAYLESVEARLWF